MDGVTYVEPNYNPIIHEGHDSRTVVVTNAGPASIRLRAWNEFQVKPDANPDIDMQLRPGNTRSLSGRLIRAVVIDGELKHSFAAIGWKVVL